MGASANFRRHLRARCHGGFEACFIQQEVYNLISRNPDLVCLRSLPFFRICAYLNAVCDSSFPVNWRSMQFPKARRPWPSTLLPRNSLFLFFFNDCFFFFFCCFKYVVTIWGGGLLGVCGISNVSWDGSLFFMLGPNDFMVAIRVLTGCNITRIGLSWTVLQIPARTWN